MIELKDASTKLANGHLSGAAADHVTLASGLCGVHVNSRTNAIVVRLGEPGRSDLYLFLDLAGAEELTAALAEQIDWLRNPNG
jgi:hypothetical protein